MTLAQDAVAQDVVVLRGATVIDGTGAPARPDSVVVIRGDRIEAIGPGIAVPPGATVVDLSGKFITPGLWDKHLHYQDWFPELLVTNGVTAGYAQAGGAWIEAQRDGVRKGKILGPRMFIRVDSIDFHGSPEEARKMTQDRIKRGADFIKLYTQATPEVAKAAAEEAHKAGRHIEGHLGITARQALEAGVDGLTHATGVELSTVKPEVLADLPNWTVYETGRAGVRFGKVAKWDESKPDFVSRESTTAGRSPSGPNPDISEYWLWLEDPRRWMLFGHMDRAMAQQLIKDMAARKMFIEGCMTYVFRNLNDHTDEWRKEDAVLLSDPNLHYVPEAARETVLDYSVLEMLKPADLELSKKGYRNYQWFVKTFVDAGGKIVIGPDTTSTTHASMLPGVSTRREMQLLVEAGLTPMQAIMAATKWPAEYLGERAKDLGTLEKGKLADLVVLGEDPLRDITAFKRVERVMQGGRFLPVGYHYYFANPIPSAVDTPAVDERQGTIASVAPASVVEGGGELTLTVKGREFLSTAVVTLAGRWLKTERVSETELRASVPAELVAAAGTYPVQVIHRPPGRGRSNAASLYVTFR
jgi:imidazolonepropionase-like amidohydrolase